MKFQRSSGILLHPTSFPGPYGIGSLGANARRFMDFLAEAGQHLWQVCPLGPTGFADSPYQCFSAFAGNPMLVDLDELVGEGLLDAGVTASAPAFPVGRVDYGPVIEWKTQVLQQSFERFRASPPTGVREEFERFCSSNAAWLDDFALFMAIKADFGGGAWTDWPKDLIQRKVKPLQAARERLAPAIERRKYDQFLFFRQWKALKAYANGRGIKILGDVPIFVAHDSADVWAHPELFHLDEAGHPTVVAGVPPDYFSETGQRWGNPLYRWSTLAKQHYDWWVRRFATILRLVDMVRLDHFRGFEAYWEVPASEPTAVNGRWVKGPGAAFFQAIHKALGDVPILAEDLGVITPEVDVLRKQFGFPGMKVLVFAFDSDASNAFLPHHYGHDCVVYTGTHDNDTAVGWYQRVSERERDFARRYLWCDGSQIAWDLIRQAYASVADLAIVPMQDALSLGNEARMNFPGRPEGNWQWRCRAEQLDGGLAARLRTMAVLYSRIPEEQKQ